MINVVVLSARDRVLTHDRSVGLLPSWVGGLVVRNMVILYSRALGYESVFCRELSAGPGELLCVRIS